jgi:hypothetical protein
MKKINFIYLNIWDQVFIKENESEDFMIFFTKYRRNTVKFIKYLY